MIGYVLLVAASVALGLLLTKVLLHSGGVASADGRFVAWLVAHRSPSLTEASLIGSIIAGGVVIPTLVGIVAAALACIRRWRVAAFLLTAIAVEAATYRLTIAFVHRDRPHVARLEHLPVNASYPSGHTAAAIAVYCGLALVLTSRFRSTWLRVTCWSLALVVPPFVALARMYRGMHHPLDSIAGVLIGVAALLVALFAARAAGFAARTRCDGKNRGSGVTSIAVVAHAGKTMGGGLVELRGVLEAEGVTDPQWFEVSKSRQAPKKVKQALDNGAELVFAWGGDGLVQQCVNVLAGSRRDTCDPARPARRTSSRPISASPRTSMPASGSGCAAAGGKLDLGKVNGERFAVMAGAGFDARMIGDADGNLKDKLGRLTYIWTGIQESPHEAVPRHDPGRRRPLVSGQGELHPRRQRRRSVRRRRGLRRRTPGRRPARAGRGDRRRPRAVATHARAHGGGHTEQVTVRADDEGPLREGQAEPEGPVRARRRRPRRRRSRCGSRFNPARVDVCVPTRIRSASSTSAQTTRPG